MKKHVHPCPFLLAETNSFSVQSFFFQLLQVGSLGLRALHLTGVSHSQSTAPGSRGHIWRWGELFLGSPRWGKGKYFQELSQRNVLSQTLHTQPFYIVEVDVGLRWPNLVSRCFLCKSCRDGPASHFSMWGFYSQAFRLQPNWEGAPITKDLF